MTPDQMLDQLGVEGLEAGADFNDGDGVMGWFGWSVTRDPNRGILLAITYTPTTSEGEAGPPERAEWMLRMVPPEPPVEGVDPPAAEDTELS